MWFISDKVIVIKLIYFVNTINIENYQLTNIFLPNPIIGKQSNISSSFFILKFPISPIINYFITCVYSWVLFFLVYA